MNKKQIIQEVLNLLSDKNKWTQYALARDIKGNRLDPCDFLAVRWCLLGAVRKLSSSDEEYVKMKEELCIFSEAYSLKQNQEVSPVHLNDCYGHKAVLKFLQTYLEILE